MDMDPEQLRFDCLKLAVYLAKATEDDALVLAQEFLAFVRDKECATPEA